MHAPDADDQSSSSSRTTPPGASPTAGPTDAPRQALAGLRVGTVDRPSSPNKRSGAGPAWRVLIVSSDATWQRRARECLGASGVVCVSASDAGAMMNAMSDSQTEPEGQVGASESAATGSFFDIALLDARLSDPPSLDLIPALVASGTSVVMVQSGASAGDVVAAMRAGASDCVDPVEVGAAELIERVHMAAENSRAYRRQRERVFTLQRLCRRLHGPGEQLARQVGELCSDLVQAYQELAGTMNQVSIAAEFKGLIRQELDIEALLRTTLEFVLARSGPTNAAVFLPTTSGDYSLGAYVNYDCPKDTCDVLLDHMANTVAPRFENQIGIAEMIGRAAIEQRLGDEAQWLGDSGVLAFACRSEHETLAIFLLFRDRGTPFTSGLVQQLQTVSDLFATQLARVIHIHHRHLPKDKWGMLGDPPADDYGDLAA